MTYNRNHTLTSEAGSSQTDVPRLDSPLTGVNIAGYFNAECGVGEAARLLIQGLDSAQIPALPYQDKTILPSGMGVSFQKFSEPQNPYPISILCMNGDGIARFGRSEGHDFLKDRYNIALWWWEVVGGFPPDWEESFQYLDEIWVASEHIYNAVAPHSPVPVTRIKLPVTLIGNPQPDHATFDLNPNDFTFLYIYDYHSTIERKNPDGLVKAYKKAFPDQDGGTALVLKCINSKHKPDAHDRILYEASERSDIHIIEEFLSQKDKDALIASSDCYVSLHRSEGLGLTPAEAMLLKKPVIATRYGGTLEFMTDDNSYLVDHEIVDVDQGAHPYPPVGHWADPDLDQAAELIRHVFENQDEAMEKGERAAHDLNCEHSPEAAGRVMHQRLVVINEALLPEQINDIQNKTSIEVPASEGFMQRLFHPFRKFAFKLMYPHINAVEEQSKIIKEIEHRRHIDRAHTMADVRNLTTLVNHISAELRQRSDRYEG